MPPKARITKEKIIETAYGLVRTNGAGALNARTIAQRLGCSTQPLFSNFDSMEEIRRAVIEKAEALFSEYMKNELSENKYPPYKASGMAYIRFAKEEKELFRLLYMRDRTNENFSENTELLGQMENFVYTNTGLEGDDAKLFHLEIWACVHGIATMLATDYLDLDVELVSTLITDVYQGLKIRHEKEQ